MYQADVFCAVSNTTNSALRTGELIADGQVTVGGKTCNRCNCLEKNKVIVDSFPVRKNL